MNDRLLQIALFQETDVVLARQRTRRLVELLGFDVQDQTRITTAVSEIARNAYEYGKGGKIEFFLIGRMPPQLLEIVISDSGPGIANVDAVLEGSHESENGLGVGVTGAQRLMDQFTIESKAGAGTTVRMRKFLSHKAPLITAADMPRIMERMATFDAFDPLSEIRQQNQELLLSLDQVSTQREELERLNQELEDTNRGVLALYAELHERADHLRRADELKSRFLSDMSHEFRTPLNSIIALSRLLLDRVDGPLTADQEKQVRFIRRGAENLTELVNDLLDLAKVEAGKIEIHPDEFTLDSLFGALRGMLRPLLVGERVALIFEDASHMPAIYGDESKVSQILRNFISNALKFTERGEVRVVASFDANGEISLSVRDTGMGIASEHLESIFEDFFQVESPAQRRHKGTGLGLPLSRKLAQLLNGRITVTSVVDQGSVFTLHLPLVYVAPDATSNADAGEPAPINTGVPILAIEDDPADLYVVQSALARSPFALMSARSTTEARRIIEQQPPAAILLDLLLGGETSWKLLASLKQDPATASIPVIVISTIADEQKALTLGADAYFHKPVDGAEILALLNQLVATPRRTRVLTIEDDESFRYIVRQLLPRHSYEVIEAATGIEGVQLAERLRPDVVLLDMNLPEMSGEQVVRQLAASHSTRDLPVILVTAADEVVAHKLSDSVHTIIAKKDLSADVLFSSIGEALRGRQQEYS